VGGLEFRSRSRVEMLDITAAVKERIRQSGITSGVCHLFVLHTTAALTVNEGADPTVQSDMIRFLNRTIPVDFGFDHGEGNSDAHIKASLIGPGVTLLIEGGEPLLGTWQAVYLCEFDGPRPRRVAVKILAA
jgi:secondary thiamine-phosphate synthase enzyme